MRLPLPYFALIRLAPSKVAAQPPADFLADLPPVVLKPVSRTRLKVLLSIFWVLLFLNFAKYILLGSVLGCG
jgi:hypothetical protein